MLNMQCRIVCVAGVETNIDRIEKGDSKIQIYIIQIS